MTKITFAALMTGAAVLFAQPVLAQTMVKEVEVETDLSAVKNERAAAFWANLSADLENAIVARITDRVNPDDGLVVNVDISELDLASTFETAMNIEDSSLAGTVEIFSDPAPGSTSSENAQPPTPTSVQRYDLTVRFDRTYLPAGTDILLVTNDSPEYYQAMINVFADRVVEKLP